MSECLFCQIEQRKVPAEIVEEDRDVIAFKDVHPKAPTHLLIVPKEHITRLSDLTDASAKVMARVTVMANRLAERFGIAPKLLGQSLRIERARGHELLRELVEAFPEEITSVSLGKPSLEDVFIAKTGHRFWEDTENGNRVTG